MIPHILAILAGIVAGFSLGLVGGGGSILATPLLIYVVGVRDPHVAIGSGATAMAVAGLFNFATHARAGNVRWLSACVFAAVGVAGALAGSTLGKAFDGQRLLALFAVLMLAVGILMWRGRSEAKGSSAYEMRSAPKVAGLALCAGLASGFFGVGGGFLIVPCLLFATRMPMIEAIGSSLLAVAAFSIATAANYAASGLVDWPIAGWFVAGGVTGGYAGMRLACHLERRKDALRRTFAVMILAVAAYMLVRSVGAMLG